MSIISISLGQYNTIAEVIRQAEAAIFERTGAGVRLQIDIRDGAETKPTTAEDMIRLLAESRGYSMADICGPRGRAPLPDIRAIITVLILQHYPGMTVSKIGRLTKKDHSTIISHTRTHQDRIDTNDEKYVHLFDILRKVAKMQMRLKIVVKDSDEN